MAETPPPLSGPVLLGPQSHSIAYFYNPGSPAAVSLPSAGTPVPLTTALVPLAVISSEQIAMDGTTQVFTSSGDPSGDLDLEIEATLNSAVASADVEIIALVDGAAHASRHRALAPNPGATPTEYRNATVVSTITGMREGTTVQLAAVSSLASDTANISSLHLRLGRRSPVRGSAA